MAPYNEKTISEAVHTEWAGKTVHFVKETDSTNIWARRLADQGAPHGALAVTEFQTAGRGRFDRRWLVPEGSSVMMSILLRPDFPPQYASMLTLVMGLSVAQATERINVFPDGAPGQKPAVRAQIKWPNDVVVSGKKICGILTEMAVMGSGIKQVVIGTGINVNIEEFPPELADKATSLCREYGCRLDRAHIIGLVMECFERNYGKFTETCDMTGLKEEYEHFLANRNQPVRVLDGSNPYEGICLGIDSLGRLLVKREDGSVTVVSAGEVSVRGLYSYV